MAAALRVVTVDRGVDPRGYTLLAFGGAGALHATDIAEELAIERVLVPSQCGVLAALGLVVAPQRRSAQRSVFLSGRSLTGGRIAGLTGELANRVRRSLGERPAEMRATYELRYRGQSFELPVEGSLEPEPGELRAAFESEHHARYGHHDPDEGIELVTIRVTALGASCTGALGPGVGVPEPGTALRGPTVLKLPESTVLIPIGWDGTVDASGAIVLERRA
jgi:N-methylhydantoinase A/oxoprolinase/acetone carboxylase beta subunit